MNNAGKAPSPRPGMPPMGPGGRPGARGPHAARINMEKPKNTKKTLKRLFKYIGKSKQLLLFMLVITLVITVLDLAGPALQGSAINSIEFSEESGLIVHWTEDVLQNGSKTQGLNTYLLLMIFVFIVSAIFSYFQSILSAKLSQNTVYNLRNDLFAKISKLPIRYTDTHKHGDIMSRMTNDVENVSNTISTSITSLFSAALTLIGAIFMMLYYSWVMMLISMITIPLTIFVSNFLSKYMRKYFVKRQRILGAMNAQVEEMVTGYKTVVSYGKEGEACEKFTDLSHQFRKCGIRATVFGGIMGPCMNLIGNLQYLLIATFGGLFIVNPVKFVNINIGNIQSILGYSKKISRPINEIANQYASILTALAGAERIFEIMDTADEIDAGEKSITAEETRGSIHFDHIDFSYVQDEPVLKNFNLKIEAGQKVAIVGKTGSGKTTLINLLTRFYDVDSGRILLDGTDIRDITKKTLRENIAIVLQDTVLFNDTIERNIRYGRLDASTEDIHVAAKTSRASEFIERMPDGYETELTEAGGNISQGQRQLLAISRAVLADPKILILDEATSSVDTRTEMHIQQAMVALMKNRTSLIIAHRLSTIRDADVIVVIKNGQVAEAGNHEELLALGGEYAELYQNQFAGIAT